MINKLDTIQQRLYTDLPETLVSILDEVIDSLETDEIYYNIAISNKNDTEHIVSYKNYARKWKYTALVDLQELKQLIIKQNNPKRLEVLLNRLINRKLYIYQVKEKIAQWKPVQANKIIDKVRVGV